MSAASVSDILSVGVAGVTLIVTCLLVIIGIRIGSEIRDILKRVEKIEQERLGVSKEIRAVQALMELFRRSSESTFCAMVSMQEFLKRTSASGREMSVLAEDAKEYVVKADRYLLYLLLLKENDGEEFSIRLKSVCALYADVTTLEFLRVAMDILPEGARNEVVLEERLLRTRIHGHDSFYWTGMH